MKTLKYIFPFALSFFCLTGCEEDERPETCDIVVKTQEATVLGNSSVRLSLEVVKGKYEGSYRTGLLYGTDASLTDAKDKFQAGNSSTQFSQTIDSLKRNTTYYFKGYVEDARRNRIEGETLSFTTRNEAFSITTGGYTQTNSQYKYLGFTGENKQLYNYRYTFTLYATLVNVEDVVSWGIVWFNDYTELYYGSIEEGTLSGTFSLLTNSSYGTHTYRAYAKLKDGTYKYGDMKTITYRHYN